MLTTIDVKSASREQMIDITDQVRRAVQAARIASGLACVFSEHTTAGVTIQENADPDVKSDLLGLLRRAIPKDGFGDFRHGEENSDAHIKTSLVGASTTVIVDRGDLVLGRWQAIFFCEFDGPRTRHVRVKVVSS